MLREAKGSVSLGSHHRLGGSNVSLFDNQKLAAVRTRRMDRPKACRRLYVKYVETLYEKYVKYAAVGTEKPPFFAAKSHAQTWIRITSYRINIMRTIFA
jgi:hypothetical protein